jgi:hypothetical protein
MKKNNYTYEDAWNYLVTMLKGVSMVSDSVNVEKLQEIMFDLEKRIDNNDD